MNIIYERELISYFKERIGLIDFWSLLLEK